MYIALGSNYMTCKPLLLGMYISTFSFRGILSKWGRITEKGSKRGKLTEWREVGLRSARAVDLDVSTGGNHGVVDTAHTQILAVRTEVVELQLTLIDHSEPGI